jgi:hypothetical protein
MDVNKEAAELKKNAYLLLTGVLLRDAFLLLLL